MARDLGTVVVRQYAKTTRVQTRERRTIIDFDQEETTLRYLLLDENGGTLRLGVEQLELDWADLVKLARLIARAGKALAEPSKAA